MIPCVAMAVLLVQTVSVPTMISKPRLVYGDMQPSFILQQDSEVADIDDLLRLERYPPIPVRPSSGVLAAEWLGGAGGGLLAGGAVYAFLSPLKDNTSSDGPYVVIFTASLTATFLGIAGGTTLVGNALTEPNGSFGKALLGALGGGVVSLVPMGIGLFMMSGLAGADFTSSDGGGIAALGAVAATLFTAMVIPPTVGAVMGYNNFQGGCCCLSGARASVNELQQIAPSVKIPFITLRN